MSNGMKWASFHVRATQAQSVTWKRHAESVGTASVGSWIATAVDAYLKVRHVPLPLAWRKGRSVVRLESGAATVNGRIVATLATFAQCKVLASELAGALLKGDLPEPAAVVERHVREVS